MERKVGGVHPHYQEHPGHPAKPRSYHDGPLGCGSKNLVACSLFAAHASHAAKQRALGREMEWQVECPLFEQARQAETPEGKKRGGSWHLMASDLHAFFRVPESQGPGFAPISVPFPPFQLLRPTNVRRTLTAPTDSRSPAKTLAPQYLPRVGRSAASR